METRYVDEGGENKMKLQRSERMFQRAQVARQNDQETDVYQTCWA
jgi:hypothetical protein